MSKIDLAQKFPWMKPIKSPPPLTRINGCGPAVFGARDHDPETGTYVTTLCFSLLFIPIFCIRAYRVARATRGWYFLGREPLSTFAKVWNVLVLVAILGTIGGVQYGIYTSSPAYKAQRQMAKARELIAQGHLGQGARIYQTLALAAADESANAAAAVSSLMENNCAQAPLTEAAGVFEAAAQIARRGGQSISRAEVVNGALKLTGDNGQSDPRSAIAILDAVRPLAIDTRPIDARRLTLLRKLAATEPRNLEVIVPLASLLEQKGELDDAKKLLLPLKDELGEGEGARVLGTILGRQGDYDGAHAQLWPYVKSRLDRLHAAEKTADDTIRRLWDREIDLLNNQKAPSDFYQKHRAAGSDEQKTIVRQYVNARIKDDPQFTGAQEALEREAAVVPVALELGIVMLQRAQGQQDPAARKAQLESTEQIFLAISGVAGQSDEYRLALGQVYYWLGKQAEGRKLFDEFLAAKGRTPTDLMQIAIKLRQLGAVPEARTMAEEAYAKASKPDDQHNAAALRALCHTDTDDQITWLRKCDTTDPRISAWLSKLLGDKAFMDGRDDEAARQYRAAIDAYAAMPRTAETVNDTALAYFGLFTATGDRPALDRCIDYFQQAMELKPSDPILLFNAGATLLEGALSDVIGSDIDLRALRDTGSVKLLGYLHNDDAGRSAVIKRVKDHPGIARALSYLDKVTVLSPKNGHAFSAVAQVEEFTRNDDALAALGQRIRAAGLDTSDELTRTREFLSGVKDQQQITKLTASMARQEKVVALLRARGGRTATVAIDELVEMILALEAYTGAGDVERAVALAEEAQRITPSARSTNVLVGARLSLVAKHLRRADSAFDAFYRKYARPLGVPYLMAVAASEPGPFQAKVLAHPQMQQALALVSQRGKNYPDGNTAYDWALLKNADPAAAEAAAQSVRNTPRRLLEQSVSNLLQPHSAGEALDTYWLMQILGRPGEAKDGLRRVADAGIPLPPIQP